MTSLLHSRYLKDPHITGLDELFLAHTQDALSPPVSVSLHTMFLPIERIFSKAGEIESHRFSCLKPSITEQIQFKLKPLINTLFQENVLS